MNSDGYALSCRSEIALSVATCLATSRLATGVLPETRMETTPVETWRSGYQKWLLVLVTDHWYPV
nr:hypothetical protein [Citrobacter freundii]